MSDEELLKRLNHMDDILHRVDQRVTDILMVIEEHRPALARAKMLMDPGGGLRAMLGKTPKAAKEVRRDDTT